MVTINDYNILIYDIESYPNYFCVGFYNLNAQIEDIDVKRTKIFEFSPLFENTKEEKLRFFNFMKRISSDKTILVGFNNLAYDRKMLYECMLLYIKNDIAKIDIATEMYKINTSIMKSFKEDSDFYIEKDIWNSKKDRLKEEGIFYEELDLYTMNRYDVTFTSLKWCEFNLDLDIKSTPYDFNKPLTYEQTNEVKEYNRKDLLATKAVFNLNIDNVNLRLNLGISKLSYTGVKIGKTTLLDYYREINGTIEKVLPDKPNIKIADCIYNKISFKTKEMQDFLENIKKQTINQSKEDSFKYEFKMFGKFYTMAKGGLHSSNRPIIAKADNDYEILDIDFNSWYPMLMIKLGIVPRHLNSKNFIECLKILVKDRLDAKYNGDKIKAAQLKETIVSLYGLLGNVHSPIRDLEAMYRTTISGQLLLLMIIERLELEGIECISANT